MKHTQHVHHLARSLALLALAAALIALAACGPTSTSVAPPTPTPSEAFRRDAETYAGEMGVTVEEALRRLQYQDDIGNLNAALVANEPATFGGLWLEHEPAFRVVVLFTRSGQRTIRPYIRDLPWAGLVEVRKARLTMVELESIAAQTARALEGLAFDLSSGIDVKGNRVAVWVTDRDWVEEELRSAGIRLPDGAELVEGEGASARGIDVCAPSPVPGVAFPRQRPVEGPRISLAALLIGRLVLVDGCLRVEDRYAEGERALPIWPAEYAIRAEGDEVLVLDEEGRVAAIAGEEVNMGGGFTSQDAMEPCVREQLPAGCAGPYWLVGDARPNLRFDSDLFALDVVETGERPFFLLRRKPALDAWAAGENELAGTLTLYDRCPRVRGDDAPGEYLVLWPPEYAVRAEGGEVAFLDGEGNVVVYPGDRVRLSGSGMAFDWDSATYRQLYEELPGDCNGPYWIAGHWSVP